MGCSSIQVLYMRRKNKNNPTSENKREAMKEKIESRRRIGTIDKEIARIKERLAGLGAMRPGTLTKQYRDRKTRQGAYYQLSYTHQMKSRTDYVRPQFVGIIRKEITEYKKYKTLTEKWVHLSIELSKLKVLQLKNLEL